MKERIATICLGLIGAGFCADEYLPVGQGQWELDAGYSLTRITGTYDNSGDYVEAAGSPAVHAFPLRFKYGVAAGWALELAFPILLENADAGDKAGVDRPELAMKYVQPGMAFGGFANIVLPFALGDFAEGSSALRMDTPTGKPGAALALGGIYDNTFHGNFRLRGLASYEYAVPSGNAKNSDILTVYVKPAMLWNSRVGTYLGMKYNHVLESKGSSGNANPNSSGNLLTVLPGLNFTQDDRISYEINIPVSVMGKNQNTSLGVWASAYFKLPM